MSRTVYLERLMELAEESLYEAELEAMSESRPTLTPVEHIRATAGAVLSTLHRRRCEEKRMRFNRIPMLVDSFNALEDLPDELDDYFVDYADPAPPRVTYFVHRTVKVGYFPGTRPPRPMFHGLGLHPPLSGASCDYGDGSCPHSPSLHRELTGTDIERWARTYPGVVLNLQGQRRYSPEKGGLETEDAAARRIRGQIVDDFKRMGVRVDLTRGIERSYKWDTPPGLLHLTVSNGYSGSAPHIHFNFEGPRRAVF